MAIFVNWRCLSIAEIREGVKYLMDLGLNEDKAVKLVMIRELYLQGKYN